MRSEKVCHYFHVAPLWPLLAEEEIYSLVVGGITVIDEECEKIPDGWVFGIWTTLV